MRKQVEDRIKLLETSDSHEIPPGAMNTLESLNAMRTTRFSPSLGTSLTASALNQRLSVAPEYLTLPNSTPSGPSGFRSIPSPFGVSQVTTEPALGPSFQMPVLEINGSVPVPVDTLNDASQTCHPSTQFSSQILAPPPVTNDLGDNLGPLENYVALNAKLAMWCIFPNLSTQKVDEIFHDPILEALGTEAKVAANEKGQAALLSSIDEIGVWQHTVEPRENEGVISGLPPGWDDWLNVHPPMDQSFESVLYQDQAQNEKGEEELKEMSEF